MGEKETNRVWYIDPQHLAAIKNLLEGHDNLALMTIVDADWGTFEIRTPPAMRGEAEAMLDILIEALRRKESLSI